MIPIQTEQTTIAHVTHRRTRQDPGASILPGSPALRHSSVVKQVREFDVSLRPIVH